MSKSRAKYPCTIHVLNESTANITSVILQTVTQQTEIKWKQIYLEWQNSFYIFIEE